MEPYYPADNIQLPECPLASRKYGLPVSVILFGTIYAMALAAMPTKSAAAEQSAGAHDEHQVAAGQGPVARTARGILVIPNRPHIVRAAAQLMSSQDTTLV